MTSEICALRFSLSERSSSMLSCSFWISFWRPACSLARVWFSSAVVAFSFIWWSKSQNLHAHVCVCVCVWPVRWVCFECGCACMWISVCVSRWMDYGVYVCVCERERERERQRQRQRDCTVAMQCVALFSTLNVIKRHYASFVLLFRTFSDAGDVSAAVHP